MSKNKTILLTVFLTLSLLGCTGSSKQGTKPQRDVGQASWPIFRGDPSLSGVAEASIPDELTLLWSFDTGALIISSPVIGHGLVYIGSTNGHVFALDLGNGSPEWEFFTGDDIEASPMILDTTLVIGSLSGELFALDALKGSVLWTYKTDNSIYGSANWSAGLNGSGKRIYVGSYDNHVYCLEAATGKKIWAFETDNYINGTPATDGSHVIFGGCDEILHVVSADLGVKSGEIWAGSYIPGSAALVEGRAYLGHYDNKLICIDIQEQKIVWEYEDSEGGGPFFSSPAVGKDRVLIGSRDAYLHCVDRLSGKRLWKFRTRDEIDGSPVIAAGKVVIGSIDGRIYILSLETGQELWSYEIGAAILGCPAVSGGFVVIGAEDGRVYVFGEDV